MQMYPEIIKYRFPEDCFPVQNFANNFSSFFFSKQQTFKNLS